MAAGEPLPCSPGMKRPAAPIARDQRPDDAGTPPSERTAKPVSERHAEALRRVEQADARILVQEERIRLLREAGQPTAQSDHLLSLMRTSRSLMQEEADLLAKGKA